MEVLQCTGTLPQGSGQWNFRNAPQKCLHAVGTGPRTMHCHTAEGPWAVGLLECMATVPRGRGAWRLCNALPSCVEAMGNGTPAMHRHTA